MDHKSSQQEQEQESRQQRLVVECGAGAAGTSSGSDTPSPASAASGSGCVVASRADVPGAAGAAGRKPDADVIKMFVGQIPKSWDEQELREMFKEYGAVYELNILRDRATGHSRGCCFVTYYTRKAALEAQNDLHNIKTLPGMHHPVQMKPADTEGKNVEERKLFIGMIPKHYNEDDVRGMFMSFGNIEDCKILRETKDTKTKGKSKGCAFITYSKKSSCIQAIKATNNQRTLEGCSAPLVVKFADTQKDKEKRQKLVEELTKSNGPVTPELLQACKDLLMQHSQSVYQTTIPGHGGVVRSTNVIQGGPQVAEPNHHPVPQAPPPQMVSILPPSTHPHHHPASATAAALTKTAAVTFHPAALQGFPTYTTDVNGHLNLLSTLPPHHAYGGLMASASPNPADTITQAYAGLQHYAAQLPQIMQSVPTTLSNPIPMGGQLAPPQNSAPLGPDGSNLFIYHLPQEFTDNDLIQMFAPFGTIISAKVFIDKITNLSKCFGFVSFDNSASAQQAIHSMNGFQIGMKRLKVQLKRSKADSKPY